MNVGKHFFRQSSLADLPPTLQVSANLIQETPSYFKLKFSAEKLKNTHLQDISFNYALWFSDIKNH